MTNLATSKAVPSSSSGPESPAPSTTALTTCPLDCPDTCSLSVTLDAGRVVKIDGDRRNPVTDGYICAKVRKFPQHVYGPDRLLYPALRVGPKGSGEFKRIPWSQALDQIAFKLRHSRQAHGGESILPFSYGGSNGHLTQDTTDERLFRRLGALRLDKTVCAAAAGAAATGLYGKMPGVSYEDYAAAEMIVIWGANPSASGIHLAPIVTKAHRAGAKLVVVDPRRTPLAKQADLHLAVRPGTDLPLALCVIRELFARDLADRAFLAEHATGVDNLKAKAEPWTVSATAEVCGLTEADIERFITDYAAASPALIRCGWGQERNRNGGSATAAILALPAVAGKFGRRGGGYTASNSSAWKHLGGEDLIGEPEADSRLVNMNRLGHELLRDEDPIQVLFVYNANPLATLPRQDLVQQGLEREDLFTVVFDQVMTDTARFADLILPATTFLEHQDLRGGYGAFTFQKVEPVIAPLGEARCNGEIFEELIDRLELSKPGDLPFRAMHRHVVGRSGLTTEQQMSLEGRGVAEPEFGRRPVQLVDVQPLTSDGKIHLFPEDLDKSSTHGLYTFQPDPEPSKLTLISPATKNTVSSTLGQLWKGPVAVEMHPDDAAARDLKSGDTVRIHNGYGEVVVPLRVSADTRPGVLFLPKGLWSRHTLNGMTGNVLAPDTVTDLADGACFNDTRVEIEKAS